MDLEHIIKLDENMFRNETDSDLQQQVMQMKHQDQWEEHGLKNQLEDQETILHNLKLVYDVTDTPMSELITYIKERIGDGSEDFEEIFKSLKKTKNIMKRQRAKNRKLSLEGRLKLENENVIFSLSQQEMKKKKNRISAQISRDKKKQYFTNLIRENQELKTIKRKLQRENIEMKKMMYEGKNKNKKVKKNQNQHDLFSLVGILSLIQDSTNPGSSRYSGVLTERQVISLNRELELAKKKNRLGAIIRKLLNQIRKLDADVTTVESYEELARRVQIFKQKYV